MTFLRLGDVDFVRDPIADVREFLTGTYRQHATLPADVVDTGFERDGEHLWRAADNTRAYVGTRTDVEVWPRVDGLGCA